VVPVYPADRSGWLRYKSRAVSAREMRPPSLHCRLAWRGSAVQCVHSWQFPLNSPALVGYSWLVHVLRAGEKGASCCCSRAIKFPGRAGQCLGGQVCRAGTQRPRSCSHGHGSCKGSCRWTTAGGAVSRIFAAERSGLLGRRERQSAGLAEGSGEERSCCFCSRVEFTPLLPSRASLKH
jgi:hypothetical protein